MKKINFLKSVLLGTLIVVCICGCGRDTAHYVSQEESLSSVKETETAFVSKEIEESTLAAEEGKTQKEKLLYIYVCGAVEKEGVYTLSEDSRVCDAFAAAGGLTPEAAKDYWNQARLLTDGEMIYVPTQEEAKDRLLPKGENTAGNTDTKDNNSDNSKININTASKEELMRIPGIGEAKAKAILNYREKQGDFSSLEELMEIEGIKEGVFHKIKDYIAIN